MFQGNASRSYIKRSQKKLFSEKIKSNQLEALSLQSLVI